MSTPPPFQEPPRRWMQLLRWFCDDRFLEEVEGDLLEWYQECVAEVGPRKARRQFIRQIVPYFRPYFFRKQAFSGSTIPLAVLQNYLKIVVRNFLKHRWTAGLNLLGLATGFAVFILIGIYVHHETHFENFHSKADRIYRPTFCDRPGQDFSVQWARIPRDFVNELPDKFPEIEHLVRFQNKDRKYVRVGTEKFRPQHAYVTDPEVFELFDFNLLEGDARTALAAPHSVVLTERLAHKYFGTTKALGQTLSITSDLDATVVDYRITGVMQDLPNNTHLPVDLLLSFNDPAERTGWAYVYTLLAQGATIEAVEAKMPDFIADHFGPDGQARVNLEFQALKDIHLHSNLAREIIPNGSAFFVRIFMLVALLVLVIAVINFVNLNSALAVGRAKEVGVRKVLGASKGHTRLYAFTEAISYNLMALLAGSGLAYALFPYFQELTGVAFIVEPWLAAGALLLIAVASGLLSGLYPAAVLNNMQLAAVVKAPRAFRISKMRLDVRRLLVALQFGISLLLIGSAWAGYQQMQYIESRNLSLQDKQILALPDVPDPVTADYLPFRAEVLKVPGVEQVAACMEVPSSEIRDSGPVLVKGRNEDPEQAPIVDMQVIDADFVDMMGLELVAGTVPDYPLKPIPTFTEDFTFVQYINEQPRSYLINETAMRAMGWADPTEAIGQEISWSISVFQLAMGPIVGVVRDFHQESLKNEIDPLVFIHDPIWLRSFLVEVQTQDLDQTIAAVGQVWNTQFPEYPFEYHFLDGLFDRLYRSERVQLQLLSFFSLLSILIAGVGLFSLVAFHLQTRLREIAIRKVLGANVGSLIRLVGREYVWLVLVGGIMAIPLSYWAVQRWLDNFAYRVAISPLWYFFALLALLGILLGIISWQTWRSSRVDPTNLLRGD